MMNTKFEKSEKPTDEWYTPQELIHCLGEFDLDPATPENRLWNTAKVHYSKTTNGLDKEWFGRVWLNPPYSRPFIELFIRRMAEHNNGIALLFNRCDSKMFQSGQYHVSKKKDQILSSGRYPRWLPGLRVPSY